MQLTWARIALSPILVALLSFELKTWNRALCAGLFILASITDWFDGYLARKYNATSTMGKFMDPIADKILVSSVLIMMLSQQKVHPIMVMILLLRDILVGGIRSVAAADRLVISAHTAGKFKTVLQMIGIPALLLQLKILNIESADIGIVLLWVSAVFSLTSGVGYYRAYLDAKK